MSAVLRRIAPGLALLVVYAVATNRGPTSDASITDLQLYTEYASAVRAHWVPYRDFGFEYPPLALLPMWFPSIVGGSYARWFGVEMAVFAVVIQELLRALAGPRAAWAWVLAPLALGAQVRTHFDLAAAAVVLAALLALVRDRPRLGFALLGVGGLLKLFPLLLVPLAAAWLVARGRAHDAVRGVLVCTTLVLAVMLPFAIAGDPMTMIRFHMDRPVQIESGPASVLFALGGSTVVGTDERPSPFRSQGLDGGHDTLVVALATGLLAVVLLAAIGLARLAGTRDGPERDEGLVWAALLALLAFAVLGKVLSPQFMMWLAPFAALAFAWRRWLIATTITAAIVLTQFWFPGRYFDLVDEQTTEVLLVAARNALLVTALAATAAALARSPSPSAATPSSE